MAPRIKGISYLIDDVPTADIEKDLKAIRDDLHCNTVMIVSNDPTRQVSVARIALEIGLEVYIRPQCGQPESRLLSHLAATAAAAEGLRRQFPHRVTFLVGNEFSLTTPGILPGRAEFTRLALLLSGRRFFDRRIARRLRIRLANTAQVARHHFSGPIGYGAGYWEQVDWRQFDFVGVNLYRFGPHHDAYAWRLRELVCQSDKPVVITEFGCGAFPGASRRGPSSFLIVNWFANPPKVRSGHVRDERVQADYLSDLIGLYRKVNVHGCFVFTYAMPDFPHHSSHPRRDLDMAGFAVVTRDENGRSHRKAAFHEVAQQYRVPP